MNFAPMMYSSDLKVEPEEVSYDLAFLGYAKDRLPQLEHYFKLFSSVGLKCNFSVVADKGESRNGFKILKSGLKYQEYLHMIGSSRAILDLVQGGQSGLSLRVLESVFLKKKLVTGNKRVKEYDLYQPENMFILTDDNVEGLKEFFYKPYVDLDKYIVEKYDFANWIEYFMKDYVR
ncbi:MAG TPA: hypothetical protein DC053_09285 [Lachnoclostridium sp.]|nr:hypothetical protein [Lachnoclostridium sp.]